MVQSVKLQCSERYPTLMAAAQESVAANQVQIRKAETMIRDDAASRGADGERYLKAYMAQADDTIAHLDDMDLSKISSTLEECTAAVKAPTTAEGLFQAWILLANYIQRMDRQADSPTKSAR
jgi:hypothetical protein